MRAEDAGGVALARADGAQVTEQRAQGRALDPHVGAEQVLAVVIEERAPDRRLEEGDAALMTRRGPGVLAVAVVARERGGERRQQALDVALNRGGGAAADECRGVFEDPDELVDQRSDFHGDRARDAAVRHDLGIDGGGLRFGARPEDLRHAENGADTVREVVIIGGEDAVEERLGGGPFAARI